MYTRTHYNLNAILASGELITFRFDYMSDIDKVIDMCVFTYYSIEVA